MKMPYIPKQLDPKIIHYRDQIVNPKTGRLYTTKPCKASGNVRYVWRNVAFLISPKS